MHVDAAFEALAPWLAEAQPAEGARECEAEVAVIEALRTALQCSQLAADTAFNQIKALTGTRVKHLDYQPLQVL